MAKTKTPPSPSRTTLIGLLPNTLLGSKGREHGKSYTDAERKLAVGVTAAVFLATGRAGGTTDEEKAAAEKKFSAHVTPEIEQALSAMVIDPDTGKPFETSFAVPQLARSVYRKIEAARLADPSTTVNFPKIKEDVRAARDHTSITLLFRHALAELGIDSAVIDEAFPSSYKGKGKSKTA